MRPRTDDIELRSRREAIRAGLGWAAAGVLASSGGFVARTQAAMPERRLGPFQLGIQSYSLRGFDLDRALAISQELGLGYWESFRSHVPPDPAMAESFKQKAGQSGVKIVGFGVVPFTKEHENNRALFEFGKAIGLSYISADPAPDSFESLDKLVEEYGIAVGIHNHGPGHQYAAIDTIAKAIKDHHPKIGCCIDTGHFLRSKEDPVRAVEVFDKRIFGVHLKDVKDATKFTILGEGDLRTTTFLDELAKRKYGYCLALEYEENEKAPVSDIQACLSALESAWKKTQASAAVG